MSFVTVSICIYFSSLKNPKKPPKPKKKTKSKFLRVSDSYRNCSFETPLPCPLVETYHGCSLVRTKGDPHKDIEGKTLINAFYLILLGFFFYRVKFSLLEH